MTKKGFVLPSIIVTGTILLIVLMFTLQTAFTTRNVLKHQHAQMLAKQAAESGLAKAKYCLYENDRAITWGNSDPDESKNKALRPNTDCYGNVISGLSKYVVDNGKYKTTFEVQPNDVGGDDSISATTTGIVNNYRANASPNAKPINTYKDNISIFMKTKTTFNDITFGNIYAKKSEGGTGAPTVTRQAYYVLKTKLGRIKFAGSNLSFQLTGNQPKYDFKFYEKPTDLPLPENSKVAKIFTNYEGEGWNVFYLTTDGNVYGTGNNFNGQLGVGKNTATYKNTYSDWNNFKQAIGNFFKGIFGFLTTSNMYVPAWYDQAKMDLTGLEKNEKVVYIYPTGLDTYILTNKGNVYTAGINSWNLGYKKYDDMTFGVLVPYSNRVSSAIHKISLPDVDLGEDNKKATTNIIKQKFYFDINSSATTLIRMKGGAVLGLGGKRGLVIHEKKYSLGYEKESTDGLPRYLKMSNGKYFGAPGQPRAIDVATDGETSWIVDSNGDVWSSGSNSNGQLGRQTDFNECIYDNNGTIVNGIVNNGNCYKPDSIEPNICPHGSYSEYIESDGQSRCRKRKYNWSHLSSCKNYDYPYKNNNGFYCYSRVTFSKQCKEDEYTDQNGKCHQAIGFNKYQEPNYKFYKVKFSSPTKIKKVVASHKVAMFLSQDGSVYGVGMNDQGQLGSGDNYDKYFPTKFQLDGEKIIDVYVTAPSLRLLDGTAKYIVNAFVITSSGKVYGTGSNYYGQLGNGNDMGSDVIDNYHNGCAKINRGVFNKPQRMKLFGEDDSPKAREIKSGFGTTMIITESNRVYTVGNNSHGQLGVGKCVNDQNICRQSEMPLLNPSMVCYPKDYDSINLAEPLFY